MKLPDAAHTSQRWRIHKLTPDFTLEDVWALNTPGGRDEFSRLASEFFAGDFPRDAPVLVRLLWAARLRLGSLLGWDNADDGLGHRVSTLRDRLPPDLRAAPTDPGFDIRPFSLIYETEDEWAAELANQTVHAVLHLGWVPDGASSYRGQLAVLVKPNGLLGVAYLAMIKPLRYLVVYPALLRGLERRWRARV